MSVTVNLPRVAKGPVTLVLPRAAASIIRPAKEVAQGADRDIQGNPVPVWLPHRFTYDSSGNLATDTVESGSSTWVRTYGWSGGAQTSDSGWVKNG